MEKMNTKQRILEAALTLFSEKGYDGVGVDQIASAVGIKGPGIYKHFSGKEDLLNKLMDNVEEHYSAHFGSEANLPKIPNSLGELKALTLGQLNFTMHDPYILKTRRLLAMEQFRNPKLAELATKHFYSGLQGMYQMIFSKMMENGLLEKGDPGVIAFEYVSPVTILIQAFDREPEKEKEILNQIRIHLDYFLSIHGVKQ